MLETYNTVLVDSVRNLIKNARESPILYFWFGFMLLFSILSISVLSVVIIWTEAEINIMDVFFTIFFLFMMKSSVDFYRYFIKSSQVSYALSTPVSQRKTTFEIFLVVFWVQLGLWALFSGIYTLILSASGVYMGHPELYVIFTLGVILSTILGSTVALHFFSIHRLRLIPIGIFLLCLWFFNNIFSIIMIILASVVFLFWSLRNSLDSFQYAKRKERIKDIELVGIRNVKAAIINKETTIIWRDNLLSSFIFSSVSTGIFIGYLTAFGDETVIPEVLRTITERLSPLVYAFLGTYIVIMYTAVFPSLNLFLAEEKTMWLLRLMPISNKKIIKSKVSSLTLSFIASIPYVAFFIAFAGLKYLLFSLWLLVFSYLMAVILSVPIGAKYVGKKSDILVLYSVAMLLFIILGITMSLISLFDLQSIEIGFFYIISILIEIGFLFGSLHLSSNIITLYSKKQKISS